MPRRITLADVAKVAGYHPTTVSMALRNHPRLPVPTIDKIKKIADEMGYRPDPVLGALVAYRSNTSPRPSSTPIAYLTYWDTELGWKQSLAHRLFYEGANACADRLGYRIDHFWLGKPELSHKRINEILVTRGIRGAIVASHMPKMHNIAHLDWERFSCVKIDFFPHQLPFHTISNDQRSITQLAFNKALEAGYQRIGCVIPQWWDEYVNKAWSAGFLSSQSILPESLQIPLKTFRPETFHGFGIAHSEFKQWYDIYKPEVLISYLPFVEEALGAYDIHIPDELAYIDLFVNENSERHLAGVRNNCFRVGELAVEILSGQLQQNHVGFPEFPTNTRVGGTWVDGETLPKRN